MKKLILFFITFLFVTACSVKQIPKEKAEIIKLTNYHIYNEIGINGNRDTVFYYTIRFIKDSVCSGFSANYKFNSGDLIEATRE